MGTTASTPHVLVCGGGIAGNAVALHLLRAGIPVTVVERADTPRPGGQAVDLRDASKEVADRMGLLPGIRRYQVDERGWAFVDDRGRPYARMPMEMFDGKGPVAEIEITRGDLNQVLLDALAETGLAPDYRYGDRAETFTQDATGVEVTFASGRSERFDLVIGADGVHSATRRLVFGPEEQFATHLGGYMAFFTIPTPPDAEAGWLTSSGMPMATFAIRPDRDPATSKAIITIRSAENPALHRDPEAQQHFIRERLAGGGWKAPLIVDEMAACTDFYFDQLARIDMPSLSRGRVTLLGDAGFCGSPLTGMGTAMAMIGAYVLAGEIATTPADIPAALARYEERITPFLTEAKKVPGGGVSMAVPSSWPMVRMMRLSMRMFTSRAMLPLTKKMFTPQGNDYVLPEYGHTA